jgi:short-subunit dehydrogenase
MIVSSMAALFPVPYQAAYSGTKAFILSFITALSTELRNPGLSLTVYTPGGIATEMTSNAKFNDLKGWLMPVDEAAKEGIHAMQTRKLAFAPGFLNRVGSVFMNFLPRKFLLTQMGKIYLKSLIKSESLK